VRDFLKQRRTRVTAREHACSISVEMSSPRHCEALIDGAIQGTRQPPAALPWIVTPDEPRRKPP
jgi:hypothetical protein